MYNTFPHRFPSFQMSYTSRIHQKVQEKKIRRRRKWFRLRHCFETFFSLLSSPQNDGWKKHIIPCFYLYSTQIPYRYSYFQTGCKPAHILLILASVFFGQSDEIQTPFISKFHFESFLSFLYLFFKIVRFFFLIINRILTSPEISWDCFKRDLFGFLPFWIQNNLSTDLGKIGFERSFRCYTLNYLYQSYKHM